MQNDYLENRLNGANQGEAAQIAGFTGRKARTPGKLIETPELKARMQQSLIRKRVTLDSIAETVANSLQANMIATTKDGEVIESDVADHKTRLKGVDQASRLWGLADQVRAGESGSTITLTLAGPLAERIAARMVQSGTITGADPDDAMQVIDM